MTAFGRQGGPGDVSNITLKDEYVEGLTPGERAGYTWYHGLALYGTTHGNITRAVKSRWQLDGEGKPVNCARSPLTRGSLDTALSRAVSRAVALRPLPRSGTPRVKGRWARQFAYEGGAGILPADGRARFMDRDMNASTYAPDFADPAANR